MEGDVKVRVLTGCLNGLPEKESSVVRIFLSSTFTDTQAERNWLMKYGVPALRKFCHERGLDFQVVDMRWGVREDATDDHRTAEVCLHEIRNSQKLSMGPNFVAFLGDKYGFRPLVTEIEAREFKLIKNMAMKLGLDTGSLLTWYQCDYNQDPTVYTLKPISTHIPQYFDVNPINAVYRMQAQRDWSAVVDKLTNIFQQSANHLYREGALSKEQHHKYFQSVTESEVIAGILTTNLVKDKVLCFVRTFVDLNLKSTAAARYTDTVGGVADSEAELLREHLRLVEIPAVVPTNHLFRYNVPWDDAGVNIYSNDEHIRYIEKFGSDFMTSIEELITVELNKRSGSKYRSSLFEEVLHHLQFCKTKCATFCGREKLMEDIKVKLQFLFNEVMDENTTVDDDTKYKNEMDIEILNKNMASEWEIRRQALKAIGVTYSIADGLNDEHSAPHLNILGHFQKLRYNSTVHCKPVIVYGDSGCGKTALMAKLTELSQQWLPGSVAIVRFLGTSPISSTIRTVLVSICMQIWEVYKVQKPMMGDLEADYQFLVHYFADLLWEINVADKPLMIVLDSADQLSASDHAHAFNWLPKWLPPGVHMLVSLVTDKHNCFENINQVFPHITQYVHVTELEDATAADIMEALCKKANRHLSKKQKNTLLEQFKVCNKPLYLKLLVDRALTWKSYTDVDKEQLGQTVREAINQFFNNLERVHGAEMIQKSIGYLCAAKDGLTEAELEDLLSLDDEVLQDSYIYHLPPDPDVIRLPPLLWKRVQYDIREYIVERQSGGKTVLTWYHNQFMEAATERYLSSNVKQQFHARLVEYFLGTWSNKFKPLELFKGKKGKYPRASRQVPSQPLKFSQTLYNTRKLNELAYHLIHSNQFEQVLSDLFCDPEWLYAKCYTMTLTLLMEDLHLAEVKCAQHIEQMNVEHAASQVTIGRKKDFGISDEKLQLELIVFESLRIVSRMVLLAADSIRKDPVNLPLMMVAQLGLNYSGNVYIEKLIHQCHSWCTHSTIPLLVPIRECMIKPNGNLLYTIGVDIALSGESRDKTYKGLYLREDINQLYVIKQHSSKTDQICIFDLHDNGSCISEDDVNFYVRSIKFVGNNKYLLLDVYTSKSAYLPQSEHHLYVSSTASPVTFEHKPKLIAVSSGTFIAYTSGTSIEVLQCDRQLQSVLKINDIDKEPTTIILSPNDTFLVFSDSTGKSWSTEAHKAMVFDLKSKQLVQTIESSSLCVDHRSSITKSELLIGFEPNNSKVHMIVIYDLTQGSIRHSVIMNDVYDVDVVLTCAVHEFVLATYTDTVIINGVENKHAVLVNTNTGEIVGKSPVVGPYLGVALFGQDHLYYAVCQWNSQVVFLHFAGLTRSPLKEAVVITTLTSHNRAVREILVPADLSIMITAAEDNTIKVWNLKAVLGDFVQQLSNIEHKLQHDLDQNTHQDICKGQGHVVDIKDISAHYETPKQTRMRTKTVALNRYGDSVYVGTDTSKLLLYTMDTGDLKLTIPLDIGPVHSMMLSRNGRYMIVAGNRIHIEDLQSQQQLTLEPRGDISCMAEANNILIAGSSGMEALARVWDIQTGDVLKDFELLYSFYCVAINSTGTSVVASIFDFPLVIRLNDTDQENPQLVTASMDTMMAAAVCCVISPDDKLAAMSSTDGSVRVIEMMGKYIFRLQQKSSAIALAFTHDGKYLLSTGYRSIYIWSTMDGSLGYKLTRHTDFINYLKFDATGKFLVTVSQDKQLVLWDFYRRVSLATFPANCQILAVDILSGSESIAYIPDGIADLAILKPNKALKNVVDGNHKALSLSAQAQAVTFTFSGQRLGQSSSNTCEVM